MSKQLTVIFKPTTRCNLRCHYCYADRDRSCFSKDMDLEEAFCAFDWVLRFCLKRAIEQVTVIWHGGEPLLMGVDFIRAVTSHYEQQFHSYSIRVKSQIQTNLTLATGEIVPILAKSFNVGFSYDYKSPHRVFANGTDAAELILKRAKAIKSNGIRAGAICLMSEENRNDIIGMYNFFKINDIPFRLNRMFPTSSSRTAGMALTVSAEQYAKGICELMDIWLDDPNPFMGVSTVILAISMFLKNASCMCAASDGCSDRFLCIVPGGNLMPCGRFDIDTVSIGNWKTDSIDEVLAKKAALTLKAEKQGSREQCLGCKWQNFCQANCMYSRLTGGTKDDCITNRIIWSHVESRLAPMGLERGILSKVSKNDASALLTSLFGTDELDGQFGEA